MTSEESQELLSVLDEWITAKLTYESRGFNKDAGAPKTHQMRINALKGDALGYRGAQFKKLVAAKQAPEEQGAKKGISASMKRSQGQLKQGITPTGMRYSSVRLPKGIKK